MLKRVFDISLSLTGLVILSFPLIILAVAIMFSSSGPVFYRGLRVGLNGRLFHILKFRSMIAGADRMGGSSTAEGDPRITGLGKFMRKYKLDELPQLFNVLSGSMSLVGPRPQVPEDVAKYNEEEKLILTVKPGITDFASIRFHNEGAILKGQADPDQAYIDLIRPEKLRLSLEYVRQRSFFTDLRIIWMTAKRLAGLPVRLP